MSEVLSVTTLVGALEAVTEFTGPVEWKGTNEQQSWLLERYDKYKNAISSIEEIQTWARRTAEELNEILQERGFDIKLKPWNPSPELFGTVGILDITLTWLNPGNRATIKDGKYPAFSHEGETLKQIYEVQGHSEPIIELSTRNGDSVFITKASKPNSAFDMIETIETLRNSEPKSALDFKKVVIPKVHYSSPVDISWLINLEGVTSHDPIEVVAALQEVRFGMNEFGARAKEATAVAFRAAGIPLEVKTYVVDEPFFVWAQRPGIDVPLFQAFYDEENWTDPGDLANL